MTGPTTATPEQAAEWGCAYILQDWKHRAGPLVRKAYRAESQEERIALLREAALHLDGMAAAAQRIIDANGGRGERGVSTIALPRIRVKRRRRKPMPPSLRRTLLIFLASAAMAVFGVANFGRYPPVTGFCTGFGLTSVAMTWRPLIREWRAWRDDE